MTERIHNITRAICRQADGPRTDGRKMGLFLTDYCEALSNAATVISNFHRNEGIRDHQQKYVFEKWIGFAFFYPIEANFWPDWIETSLFYPVYKKGISFENKERLVIEYSIRLDKNRTPIQNEINVLLYEKHESLPPLNFKSTYGSKGMNFFE